MNISRFFGATNREALRQVRLALGPDALIVSNKRVNGGVEILATDETQVSATAAPDGIPAGAVRPSAAGGPALPRPAEAAAPAGDVLGVIGELKGSLESRIDELLWGSQLRQSPAAVALFQSLLRFGFSTALLRAMLKRLPAQVTPRAALQWARDELVAHLPVLTTEAALWQPGLALALVGPTGVGKTTTIAKLAARCVRRSGPGSLVLLTTDTYRIGAHEQLKIYGQMLHVPVRVAQDAQEFRQALQSVRPDQTVLIDNVGISQRDRYIAEQAALLAGAGRQVERLLVLNAASQGDTLDEVARSYAGDGGTALRGCLITKIDEASSLGAALDTAIRYRLPIHYVSNGQKVPENLLFLSAAQLVDRALAPVQGQRTLYAPSEADLAALLSATPVPEDPQAAVRRRREERLLPQLLTQSVHGDFLGLDHLQEAAALLDEDPALAEAYDLWRSRSTAGLPAAAEAVDHLWQVAQGNQGAGRAWVVHDRQRLDGGQGGRGTWFGATVLDAHGAPLVAGGPLLSVAGGWYTPHGAHLQAPEAAAIACLQAGTSVAGEARSSGHFFGPTSQTVLRALEARGAVWIAACSARASVREAGETCVASAAAQRLVYQSLPSTRLVGVPAPAGSAAGTVTWWAGGGPVELSMRGEPPFAARLFAVRAVDGVSGRVLRTWHALGTAAADLPPDHVAALLVLHGECHVLGRVAAATLAADTGDEPLVDRALYCAQLALAAWRLVRLDPLAPVAQVASRMMGVPQLPLRQALPGLLKLFTLKELLAV